jgi:hypothetical protein
MSESLSFGPVVFTGNPSQDPKDWLQSLEDYMAYKAVSTARKAALFKLRPSETASDWLLTLPLETQDSFDLLSDAFLERLQPKELEKYRYAKDVFSERQQATESVDNFISNIRRRVSTVGMDPQSQVWAAINGFLSQISAYVLEHAPETLDDVLRHA